MSTISTAKQYLGMHEVKHNKILRQLLKAQSIKNDISIDPATTAWCAAFVNAIERKEGRKGNGRLNARSFLTYGSPVALKEAKAGDIVIFARGGSTWMGHVSLYVSQDATGITCLGGNQSDSVSYGWYPKARLLGIRRP